MGVLELLEGSRKLKSKLAAAYVKNPIYLNGQSERQSHGYPKLGLQLFHGTLQAWIDRDTCNRYFGFIFKFFFTRCIDALMPRQIAGLALATNEISGSCLKGTQVAEFGEIDGHEKVSEFIGNLFA